MNSNNESLKTIEQNHLYHFTFLPKNLGFDVYEINDVTLITREDFLRKGYGSDMMVFLMNIAKNHGCHSVTLSASSDSGYRIYERLGFSKVGEFECFEYKGN